MTGKGEPWHTKEEEDDDDVNHVVENIPARKKAPNIRLRSVSVDVAESSNLNLDNLQDKKKSSSLTNTGDFSHRSW